MRILILSNYGLGLYKFRRELITELLKSNDVTVSIPHGDFDENIEELGCKVVYTDFNRRGKNPFTELKLLKTYYCMIKVERSDVILTYTIKPNVYGGMVCRMMHIPYIANVTGLGTSIENGGMLAFITKFLYKIGLKKASCVFFQNQPNHDLFIKNNIVQTKTHILPGSGVNINEHVVEPYPETTDGVRFLFIGRIMKDKGINELLTAIHTVKEQYPCTSLDIVGGCDEDYGERLKTEEQDGYISYHGEQPSVNEFIRKSHCTILPSYHEGTANVLLESASTGRPVIASRVTGCIETFDEDITGFGCEVKNAQSLADTMIKFIELPYEQKKQMGIEGRKKMEREFDRSIVINSYIEEINLIKED